MKYQRCPASEGQIGKSAALTRELLQGLHSPFREETNCRLTSQHFERQIDPRSTLETARTAFEQYQQRGTESFYLGGAGMWICAQPSWLSGRSRYNSVR